jgi:thiamine kinase-like enzyme
VTDFVFKKKSEEAKAEAFTGLAFILETDIFWPVLENCALLGGEKQVIAPFQELARQGKLYTTSIHWTDTGLKESYLAERKKEANYDFSKVQEALYMVSGRVIKYFEDDEVSSQRVQKAKLNPAVFPAISGHRKHMYCYEYQAGRTLYDENSPDIFRKLLHWLDRELWLDTKGDTKNFKQLCDKFYREKTLSRIAQFSKKYPDYRISVINGKKIPDIGQLLEQVKWSDYEAGVPVFIHGDLQPDNIIYDTAKSQFLLLDWRHNFGGEVAFGDLYYDFAKLWGGINLNYKEVKNNKFNYTESGDSCSYEFPQHKYFSDLTKDLEALAVEKNLSVQKIKRLVGLIYLNMSPLHHYPFDKMLFAMGRDILNSVK